MSWESSAHYYRLLTELTRERLGGHGLDVRVPGPAERVEVNRVIFEELVRRWTGRWRSRRRAGPAACGRGRRE